MIAHTPFTHLIIWLIAGVSTYSLHAQTWEISKETSAYKAYGSTEELKSYKLVGEIQADKECTLAFMTDILDYPNRFDIIAHSEILEKHTDYIIYYFILDLPWPFDDRDVVAKTKISRPSADEIVISTSLTEHDSKPVTKDYVRVPVFQDEIHLKQINEQTLQFTFQGKTNFGGGIPLWLQNLLTVEGPIKTADQMIAHCAR